MREAKWRRYARFSQPDVGADVDDELEFHVQLLVDRYLRAGHTPEEARTMAAGEFGDRTRAREQCVDIDTTRMRESSRREAFENLITDLRHGTRRLVKNPVFAIVTILTLAIGIGPNIAIFSIINSVLLQPLPYAHPEQLVSIQESFPIPGGGTGSGSVSYPNYLDWKSQSRSFDFAISSYAGSANLTDAGEPERLSVAALGVDAFDILGVHPILGRSFAANEGAKDAPIVALIGEGFWRRRFNGDRSVIGRKITLDGTPATVVGVIPATVPFPNRTTPIDVWMPLQVQVTPNSRGSHAFLVVARLKAGATLATATTEMTQIAARLAELYPKDQEKRGVQLVAYTESVVGGVRHQLAVLLGAAGLVLLIACANAASLLLARAGARQREVAVLAALGASRWRVAQQFLVESLLLSAAGAALGFVLSRLAVKAIVAGAGTSLPRSTQIHFDYRVVLFIVGVIVLTTVLFGLVPALQATRADLQDCLRSGGRSGTGGRRVGLFRNSLVVGQFALSLVLLSGAGLLLRTFAALLATPTGMSTEHVLTVHIPFPLGSPKYPKPNDALTRFFDPMLAGVRALPGVQSAGMINLVPLAQYGNNGNFAVAGHSYASVSEKPFAEFRVVSPGYFATLHIPIVSGRDALPSDLATTQQVVLINQELAKRIFPNEDPIGKVLQFGTAGTLPPVAIVGVVGNVRQARLDQPPLPELYFPAGQAGGAIGNMTLLVRTTGDPTLLTKSVVGVIRSIDPSQPVYGIQSMTQVVEGSVASSKLYLGLLAAFAGIALALAIAGIYGVMSYAVSQRTREFGIRLALGSETTRVQRLVVWEGTRLALSGLVIGVPSAYLLTKLLSGVLYGVAPGDPETLIGVSVLLATVSVAASYLPSRRVTSVDPIVAMRAE